MMALPGAWVLRALALVSLAFGVASIQDAGRVIFAETAVPCDSCPLLLWFTFIGGFVHLVIAAALWRGAAWTAALAAMLVGVEALVLMLFFAELRDGAPYERVRGLAMTADLALAVVIAIAAWPRAERLGESWVVSMESMARRAAHGRSS